MKLQGAWKAILPHLILIPGALWMVLPFVWMLSTSLKEPGAVFGYPPQWIPEVVAWENYVNVVTAFPFGRYFLNTVFVSSSVTLLQLLTCSMAAFAFARLRFRGREMIFLLYLATLMVPEQVRMVPNFILVRMLGWIDTYYALVVPAAFSAFGTFLLRQFFLTLPRDLEDSAKIDGCGYFRIYTTIILPLAKPALAALAIFTFMWQWNSFLWPLIVISKDELRTLTIGLRALQGLYYTEWNLLMAGSLIALVPVLAVFFVAQKQFIQGITLTGFKG